MRILLAIHNAYTDTTSGAAQSVRTLMQWLAQAGHECRVLATFRFDGDAPATVDGHLSQLGVAVRRQPPPKSFVRSVAHKPANTIVGRPIAEFTLRGVPVTTILTRAAADTPADRLEAQQLLFAAEQVFEEFRPDILLTYGGHPVIQELLRQAHARGIRCVFTLRNVGYEDRRYFAHVDHVLTTCPYLSDVYRRAIGLRSTGIDSPIDWDEVEAPPDLRRFVTFVNPSLAKGALLFARLADMLGSRRPDIPILVVQSAAGAAGLNEIHGLDFAKYPHIMVAPPTPRASDFFALTKILLVPSVVKESFGRVAAEALINGIPPLVSDRGGMPETIAGAGRVLPLPPSLTVASTEPPTEAEVQPWYDAVCALWDDPVLYAEESQKARAVAESRFAEEVMRRQYEEYFASLSDGEPLFD